MLLHVTCLSKSALEDEPRLLQVEREIMLQSRLVHCNIISLYAAFQDAEGIYLILVCSRVKNVSKAQHSFCQLNAFSCL